MGLDLYAGPVARYVAGDWKTIVQQAGEASGTPVTVMRWNEPANAIHDIREVDEVVRAWRGGVVRSLGLDEAWDEDPAGEYYTDKPDWDGFGAVVLLAAYDEQPSLAPGSPKAGLFKRSLVPAVDPRRFPDAEADKLARKSPVRYPTLLLGAEWCLPLAGGPAVFQAPMPNRQPKTMGRVSQLIEELNLLNDRTLHLSDVDLSDARKAGPPAPGSPVEAVAPFGLAVLLAVAQFAASHRVAWIMDY